MALETITIGDPVSGSIATVVPGFGMNCYRFQVRLDGKPVDVLWSVDDFASGDQRPSGSGIPILFPFPGRIQGAQFSWEGRSYSLDADDGQGNAIHGFVHNRPWRIVQHSDRAIVGQFQASVDDSSLLDHWPADFRITATYELADKSLKATYLIENPGEMPLPCGFGTHPYFCVPVGGGDADQCRLQVPVSETWELDDLIPTGKRQQLKSDQKLRSGVALREMNYDDVFGGVQFDNDVCTTRIDDPQSGHSIIMTFNRAFSACVVYNPPHREAVCIEPYTCVPDPIRLSEEGVDTGLLVLQPGDGVEAKVEIRVE